MVEVVRTNISAKLKKFFWPISGLGLEPTVVCLLGGVIKGKVAW